MKPDPPDNKAENNTLLLRSKQVGQIIGGLILGAALFPAALELISLVGNISPFRYQGF